MADTASGWVPGEGGFSLRLGGFAITFQRFQRPDSGVVAETPPSLGALPVARAAAGGFLLPLAAGEAFWIGLSAEGAGAFTVVVRARAPGGAEIELDGPRIVPPAGRIAGVRQGNTSLALCRTDKDGLPFFDRLLISVRSGKGRERIATVDLVDYVAFTAGSGRAAPDHIDPDAGYKGHLLP